MQHTHKHTYTHKHITCLHTWIHRYMYAYILTDMHSSCIHTSNHYFLYSLSGTYVWFTHAPTHVSYIHSTYAHTHVNMHAFRRTRTYTRTQTHITNFIEILNCFPHLLSRNIYYFQRRHGLVKMYYKNLPFDFLIWLYQILILNLV